MSEELARCVELIRIASNSLPNIPRVHQQVKIIRDEQSPKKMKKTLENQYTGFYGLWSPRSKQFVFGIQEESRELVGKQAKQRLGKRWKYDFEVRKIRYRDKCDFNKGIRRKEYE